MKQIIPINAMPDGTCRTIKAQHCKASGANFIRQGSMGVTAVLEIGDIARCLPAHYFKAGWHDFDPTSNIPHTAIIEIMEEPCILGYTRDDKGNVTSRHEKEIAGTLHTSTGSGGNTDQFVKTRYRIRKLSPRECFRLMDMDDSDINKIEAYRIKVTQKSGTVKEKPIPKSRKYMLAGNSIVVSCLYHIFHQMFIAEPPEPKPIQKSLFD